MSKNTVILIVAIAAALVLTVLSGCLVDRFMPGMG